jgi:membrane protein
MNKNISTILKTIQIIKETDLLVTANSMTYKLLFAIFPFMMFLLTLMGFFTIDFHHLTYNMEGIVPTEALIIVENFAAEVINVRRPRLLSISLAIALFSSTSGFSTLIFGIKKAYQRQETRGYMHVLGSSVALVLLFTVVVVFSTVGIIFSGEILDLLAMYYTLSDFTQVMLHIVSVVISLCIMLAMVIAINYIVLEKNIKIKSILPGAIFTVIIWGIASFGFNMYISNFNNMSTVYGSVAGLMIFIIWLNIICSVLLVGGALNGAILSMSKE